MLSFLSSKLLDRSKHTLTNTHRFPFALCINSHHWNYHYYHHSTKTNYIPIAVCVCVCLWASVCGIALLVVCLGLKLYIQLYGRIVHVFRCSFTQTETHTVRYIYTKMIFAHSPLVSFPFLILQNNSRIHCPAYTLADTPMHTSMLFLYNKFWALSLLYTQKGDRAIDSPISLPLVHTRSGAAYI